MFGKVKKFLGIEGVKVEMEIPESIERLDGRIPGTLTFTSMQAQLVESVTIVLVERYNRGRKKEKLTDEYELGRLDIKLDLEVSPEGPSKTHFELHYELLISEMDELENKNLIYKGLIKSAKWLRNVKSEYRVEAEAKIKGTILSPFDKKPILLT